MQKGRHPKTEQSPNNSREGEDQKVLNRDHKVEGVKDDLQQAEFNKCELLSSTNRDQKLE